jgi:hypothetical protein
MSRWGVVGVLALAAACTRKGVELPDAAPEASAPVSVVTTSPSDDASAPRTTTVRPPPGEARRSLLAKLDAEPLLAAQIALVSAHFGKDAKGPFALQRTELAGGRSALFVAQQDGADPMLLVFDGDTLLWSREHPVAGIVPPVEHVALAAHEAGGTALAAWDPATKLVVGRVAADDGNPFGDFQVMNLDACDDVTVGYWPGRGILFVASTKAGPRMQLMREDNTFAFAREGIAVGTGWRAAGPVTMAFDSPTSVMLVQHASGTKPKTDAVKVFRYSAGGKMLWEAAVEVEVPTVPKTTEHLVAAVVRDGVVRIELPRGAVASQAKAVEVDSTGAVVRLAK